MLQYLTKTKQRPVAMTDYIDVHDLSEEDVQILEKLAAMLREREKKKKILKEEDGLALSAGAWKGLIDGEELKRNIYADRLISTRPPVKL